MPRRRPLEGQLSLPLEDLPDLPPVSPPVQTETPPAEPATEQTPSPVTPHAKKTPKPQQPKVYPTSGVRVVKQGSWIGLIACDKRASLVLQEFASRQIQGMCRGYYYGLSGVDRWEPGRISLFDLIRAGKDILDYPSLQALRGLGIELHVDQELTNWFRKETRRYQFEKTGYWRPEQTIDVPLFYRCVEGMVLTCHKQFKTPQGTFEKGKKYAIGSISEDGTTQVNILTVPASSGEVINETRATYPWTEFDAPMEEVFEDESASVDIPDRQKLFPEVLARNKAHREKLGMVFPKVHKHVEEDLDQAASDRAVLNTYPMRMAKTSWGIAYAEMAGSQKVAILSPNNARIAWENEFERMGFERGKDYQPIKSFADTEKPAKYHLMTLPWLRQRTDKLKDARQNKKTILAPYSRTIRHKDETEEIIHTNNCPHCGRALQRIVLNQGEDGQSPRSMKTEERGYRCFYKTCPKKGAYVDYELARHVNCPEGAVQGRQCGSCGLVDGTWIPPRYRRISRKYTLIEADEIHDASNNTAQSYQAMAAMRGRRKVGLTGTPTSSKSVLDSYWILHALFKGPSARFPFQGTAGASAFDRRFCDAINVEKNAGQVTDENGVVHQVKKTIRKRIPFLKDPKDFWAFSACLILRRNYNDPKYQESLQAAGYHQPTGGAPEVIPVLLSKEQAELMLKSVTDFRTAFEQMATEAKTKNQEVNWARVQNMSQMITLRILATCPEYLNQKLGATVYKGQAGGSKMDALRILIPKYLDEGKKIVVLSDFHAMQAAVEKEFSSRGLIRFLTSWSEDRRAEAFEDFAKDPKARIFVAGTQAVYQSIDLSAADVLISTDLLWSSRKQSQAWARVMAATKRQRHVTNIVLTSKGTIDEEIFNSFYANLLAAEQALDRKTINRRARKVDVTWFVEKVIETERFLKNFLDGTISLETLTAMPESQDGAAFEELLGEGADVTKKMPVGTIPEVAHAVFAE